jgi:asparagine synthase (glutamine-hydrolysing)
MCGIVGILKSDSGKSIKREVESLLPYIDHRGPDAWGSYGAYGIGLGHTRLSIIDLENGHQPMVSKKSSLSFNGEIYNYIELRKELETEGAVFLTNSDTEVVQRSIEFWGTEAFSRFNGQFAILYWDKSTERLIAARDRYGIRPLYFMLVNDSVYFSSELKVFDHLGSRKRHWSHQNLLEHGLLWNTLGSNTLYENIHSLEGGHFQVFTSAKIHPPETYYTLGQNSLDSGLCNLSFNDQVQAFREKLKDSVRLRLRSDVPVGCYLSGGIDSSVTSYLAKDINKQPFKSFSVTFDDPSFDESEFQNEMVSSLDFDHHTVRINSTHIEENFFNAAKHFERPVFRTAPVPLYLLSEKVRNENIKVVLTGEAADEILFGYDTNKELKLLSQWKKGMSDKDILNIIVQLNPHLDNFKDKEKVGFLKMYYEGFLNRFDGPLAGLIIRVSNNQILSNMFNKDWQLSFDMDDFSQKIWGLIPDHVKEWSLLKRNQYLEMKTLLPGYLLSAQGDRMAMAHGIEGRFPFLDHNLIEWLLTVPDNSKLKDFSAKHLLKEAFKDNIPDMIINRPKRPYTAPDLASFFPAGKRGRLVDQYLNREIVSDYGIYDPRMVERFIFKMERRGIESAGYRDNMLISYLLSNQIIEYQIRNPENKQIDYSKQTINILEKE